MIYYKFSLSEYLYYNFTKLLNFFGILVDAYTVVKSLRIFYLLIELITNHGMNSSIGMEMKRTPQLEWK